MNTTGELNAQPLTDVNSFKEGDRVQVALYYRDMAKDGQDWVFVSEDSYTGVVGKTQELGMAYRGLSRNALTITPDEKLPRREPADEYANEHPRYVIPGEAFDEGAAARGLSILVRLVVEPIPEFLDDTEAPASDTIAA